MTTPCRACGGPREQRYWYAKSRKHLYRCAPCHTKAEKKYAASGKRKIYDYSEYGRAYRARNKERLRAYDRNTVDQIELVGRFYLGRDP